MPKRSFNGNDREDDTESISNQSAPKRTRKGNDDLEIVIEIFIENFMILTYS